MAAVPLPWSVKDSLAGSGPDSMRAGAGYPVVVIVRCRGTPTLALAAGLFWMRGALVIVRVNAWVAVPVGFLAVSVSGYTPAAMPEGVPEMVAVPLLSRVNFTPDGSRPVFVIFGAGEPVAVTVKLNATPKDAVYAGLLVKSGPPAGVTVAGSLAPESPTEVWATTVTV